MICIGIKEPMGLAFVIHGSMDPRSSIFCLLVDHRGSPVWLGIPAARGYLGAVAIHEDFSGIVAKVAIGPLQIGDDQL